MRSPTTPGSRSPDVSWVIKSRSPRARSKLRKLPCSTSVNGPLRIKVLHSSAAVAPPAGLSPRGTAVPVSINEGHEHEVAQNQPCINNRIIAMLCSNPWRSRSDSGEPPQLTLLAVTSENGCFSRTAPGSTQALTQAGHRWRRPDLYHRLDAADIDPKLQRSSANCGGRPVTALQRFLGFLSNVLRQTAVMRPELVRQTILFATAPQIVSEPLHLSSTVREDQVVAAP